MFLLTNKGFVDNTDIILKLDKKIITDETKLVESFNDDYANIVQKNFDLKPTALGQKSQSDKAEKYSTIESYKNHLSIKNIRNNLELLENEKIKMVTMVNFG